MERPKPFHGNRKCELVYHSNSELVNYLTESGWILSDFVYKLMSSVDRKIFSTKPELAYADVPQFLSGSKSIHSPRMCAIILELFRDMLQMGKSVLITGCGTGYLTTCMALAIGKNARVVGMDSDYELVERATAALHENYKGPLEEHIEYSVGNIVCGLPPPGPYDMIFIATAAPTIPRGLYNYLAPDGRLLMPVGTCQNQALMQVDRFSNGRSSRKTIMELNCREELFGSKITPHTIYGLSRSTYIKLLYRMNRKNSAEQKLIDECFRNIKILQLVEENVHSLRDIVERLKNERK